MLICTPYILIAPSSRQSHLEPHHLPLSLKVSLKASLFQLVRLGLLIIIQCPPANVSRLVPNYRPGPTGQRYPTPNLAAFCGHPTDPAPPFPASEFFNQCMCKYDTEFNSYPGQSPPLPPGVTPNLDPTHLAPPLTSSCSRWRTIDQVCCANPGFSVVCISSYLILRQLNQSTKQMGVFRTFTSNSDNADVVNDEFIYPRNLAVYIRYE